jgi:glycosyltransferase involved in cell wall biosynthesis
MGPFFSEIMKLLGLIASPTDPASRYRLLQYKPYLKSLDIELEARFFLPAKDSSPARWTHPIKKITGIGRWKTWNILQDVNRLPLLLQQFQYDVIWQSRMLLPYLLKADRAINKPVVFDIDDAVWLFENKGRLTKAIAASAEVFAGNEYLADWCSSYSHNVTLVPTTVDISRFFPLNNKDTVFTIGWIGTHSNFKYLELIKDAINQFLRKYDDARFVLISSTQPDFLKFDQDKVVFRQWDAATENDQINEFTTGIMPLADDDWTRGKCGFKLLQYMACSKPVIASPVGVNKKLLAASTGLMATTPAEWLSAFEELYQDRSLCRSLGQNGRRLVEREYNTSQWASNIADRFQSLKK